MYFLMTNDVECQSIALNRIEPKVADEIYEVGLPMLLNLLSKYDVVSTFYFTGKFVELKPEAVDLVKEQGHEIGCHGYDHSPERAFDLLTYEQQVEELRKAKNAIEPVAGKIQSFRAPALRINISAFIAPFIGTTMRVSPMSVKRWRKARISKYLV